MNNNRITELSDREHVLLRPNVYIGSVNLEEEVGWVYNPENKHFEYKTYSYIQALLKIVNEIIDNSVDEAIRTNFEKANVIKININDINKKAVVSVTDNGRGIPIENIIGINGKEVSQLEAAFTRAKAGSNFSNDNRKTIGTNGVGSFCTAVFSESFIVETRTTTGVGKLSCKHNLLEKECSIKLKKSLDNKTGTTVTFLPDYSKFNTDTLDIAHVSLIQSRLLNLSIAYPKIKFYLNDVPMQLNKKEYLGLFGDTFEYVEDKEQRFLIGVYPNDMDNFIQSSCVNGLNIKNGGSHVDYILSGVIQNIIAKKALKKYNIKPGDVKNKLKLVVVLRDFANMQFDSQTKEKITNSNAELKAYLGDIDFKYLSDKIYANQDIIEPIILNYKLKEKLKTELELSKATRSTKNYRCEKYFPAIGDKKYLLIEEGDSASSSMMAILGRKGISHFATRGVPLNAYIANKNKLSANAELMNLVKILNLNITIPESQVLTHDYVVLATDNDLDAYRIRGLYVGFFKRYAPWLLKQKKVLVLNTPLIEIFENKKVVKYFMTFEEYNNYLNNNAIKKNQSLVYCKGLGTHNIKDLNGIIQGAGGLEKFLEPLSLEDATDDAEIDNWLGDTAENTKYRQKVLLGTCLDINKI